jgi:hypothetical protein
MNCTGEMAMTINCAVLSPASLDLYTYFFWHVFSNIYGGNNSFKKNYHMKQYLICFFIALILAASVALPANAQTATDSTENRSGRAAGANLADMGDVHPNYNYLGLLGLLGLYGLHKRRTINQSVSDRRTV